METPLAKPSPKQPPREKPSSRAKPISADGGSEGEETVRLSDPMIRDFGEYVASLCAELSSLASKRRLSTLRYMLSLAHLEAERISRGLVVPDGDSEHPSH